MCEAIVFLDRDGNREKLMENVAVIKPESENLLLVDLFGERREVKAKIKEIKLVDHEVILSAD